MPEDTYEDFFGALRPARPSIPPTPPPPEHDDSIEDCLEVLGQCPLPIPLETIWQRAAALRTSFPNLPESRAQEVAERMTAEVLSFITSPERSPRERSTLALCLEQGFVTKQDCYGMGFDPVVTRDLTKHGLVFYSQRGQILLDLGASNASLGGFSTLPSRQRDALLADAHFTCVFCRKQYERKFLTADHRVPHRVAGNSLTDAEGLQAYQVACYPCNNRKQQGCRACTNQQTTKDIAKCRTCYWAYPDKYEHIAGKHERRLTLVARTPEEMLVLDEVQKFAAARGL